MAHVDANPSPMDWELIVLDILYIHVLESLQIDVWLGLGKGRSSLDYGTSI